VVTFVSLCSSLCCRYSDLSSSTVELVQPLR